MITVFKCNCWGGPERRVIWLGGENVGDRKILCRACFYNFRQLTNDNVRMHGKYSSRSRIMPQWNELKRVEEEK